MCQAKPGPRCSGHTAKEVEKLKDSPRTPRNREKYQQAVADYMATPKGQREVNQKIEEDEKEIKKIRRRGNLAPQGMLKRLDQNSRLKQMGDEQIRATEDLAKVNEAIENGEDLSKIDPHTKRSAMSSHRVTHDIAVKTLESFGKEDSSGTSLARNTAISPKTIDYLADRYDPQSGSYYGNELASNPRLSPEAQMKLIDKAPNSALEKLSNNPALSVKAKNKLIDNKATYESILTNVASHENNSSRINHKIASVRYNFHAIPYVAKSPNTKSSTLEMVRDRVTNEEQTVMDKPQKLYDHGTTNKVYQGLSTNPNTSSETLDKLSKSVKDNPSILNNIKKHPNTSETTRRQLESL